MLFKAKVDEGIIDAIEGVKFEWPEYTEIETNQGFKYGRALFNDKSLKPISEDGEIIEPGYFEFTSETHKYYMIPRNSGKIRTRTRYKIIGSDYSAQEPRLTAFISQDQQMIDAYMKGQDLYAVIAQSAFDNNYEDNLEFYPEGTVIEENGKQITCGYKTHMNKQGKERRKIGKVLQLAATYGMSGTTAGIRMGKDAEQGEILLMKFFNKFRGVADTIAYSKQFLADKGYVEDWAGRRRHLDIKLKKYEAHLKDNNEKANFNPFLNCANRDDQNDPSVRYWLSVIENRIQASQGYQVSKVERWNKKHPDLQKTWTPNGEMSNMQYDEIAKLALNCTPFDKKDKRGNLYVSIPSRVPCV